MEPEICCRVHWTLSWATWPHTPRRLLIASYNLRQGFPTKVVKTYTSRLPHVYYMFRPSILLYLIALVLFGEEC
jgi:hypothetical protein